MPKNRIFIFFQIKKAHIRDRNRNLSNDIYIKHEFFLFGSFGSWDIQTYINKIQTKIITVYLD